METSSIEIFQTIRASMQPYAAMGFNAEINSENEYKLSTSENPNLKNRQFCKVYIQNNQVYCCLFNDKLPNDMVQNLKELGKFDGENCFLVNSFSELSKMELEEILSVGYKLFKFKHWV
ncbi:hypothetical protein [Pedobacter flavus]|uniref:DUF1801 domain-containing protein n=1 Tax=Pedobacter flavus TaxID=3113906 RepID=A0ABU7H2K5_9SPHI|nr:hypothetical protein [Pedobacter sp. VNH31]MEE1885553.1 hypothetical protein [Pedobacter sp. VNH31]